MSESTVDYEPEISPSLKVIKSVTRTDSEKSLSKSDNCESENTLVSQYSPSDSNQDLEKHSKVLEQLASTNKITVRINWNYSIDDINDKKNNYEHNSDNNSNEIITNIKNQHIELITQIESLIKSSRGMLIETSAIEDYEFLSDKRRLEFLKENINIFTFEQGSKEFASSAKNKSDSGTYTYHVVLQGQTKKSEIFDKLSNDIKNVLIESENLVQRWSISINKHALTHPGNLYIRGIPKDLTIDDLKPIFDTFGKVLSLKIICDLITGESLGYGFISFKLGSEASNCINKLNGTAMNGSTLFINYHVERKEREKVFWNNFKENNDDNKFKGIFIGNIPKYKNNKQLVTTKEIIEKITKYLEDVVPNASIISFYFPKQCPPNVGDNPQIEGLDKIKDEENRNKEDVEDDDTITDDDSTAVVSKQNSDSLPFDDDETLKGYGFIKFQEHEHAIDAMTKLEDLRLFGNKLIINKAIQSKYYKNFNGFVPRLEARHSEPFSTRSDYPLPRRRASDNTFVSRNSNSMFPPNATFFQGQPNIIAPTFFENTIPPAFLTPFGHLTLPNNGMPISSTTQTQTSTSTTATTPPLDPLFIPNQIMPRKSYISPFYSYGNMAALNNGYMPNTIAYTSGGNTSPDRVENEIKVNSNSNNNASSGNNLNVSINNNNSNSNNNNNNNSNGNGNNNSNSNKSHGHKNIHHNHSHSTNNIRNSISMIHLNQQGQLRPSQDQTVYQTFAFNNHNNGNASNNIITTNNHSNGIHSANNSNNNNMGHNNMHNNLNNNVMNNLNTNINNNGMSNISNMRKYSIPSPTNDQQESNIYIKHLPLSWVDHDLYKFYEKFGPVISAKIITVGGSKIKANNPTNNAVNGNEKDAGHLELPIGASKGYGFVYFKNPLDASKAVMSTDGIKLFDDHILSVSFAQKKDKKFKNKFFINFDFLTLKSKY
ncbi:hypothetical protein TBLA_0B08010 [Henningerozyma blattae CBS 6284]|uniref:RRM domain-containing protein n=1 Tax=Henningerozyma blattae (strain ATCC 34711 / CBS 6284 / DSM 70876 / NBRC 10599 / NRRL Y-10934 / UCD 77-7) TaxID=1071380 RepID=I2GZR5_HENB6|nr:hypothetical protein TBLA_0B08010 [Tetrapisispora blattae CBS 6284]CCH59617.1 hypothetical protein TBLA_0B08010 [Tetrapisispora blattae CBS 6284]